MWRDDPLIATVELQRLEMVKALAAGVPQPETWRLELSGADGVPALALTLRDAAGREWVVSLDAGSTTAEIIDGASPRGVAGAIDLDASGMRDAPW